MADMKDKMSDKAAKNRVEGAVNEGAGRARSAVGDLTDDSSLQLKGKGQQLKGKAQQALADVQEKLSSKPKSDV